MQLTLRGDVGAGDLVSDHAATVVSEQLVDEGVLDGVGLGWRLRSNCGRELGQALVIDPGLGEEFGARSSFKRVGHLNIVTATHTAWRWLAADP